jgi:hypothetical protein
LPGRHAEAKNVGLITIVYDAGARINRGVLNSLHAERLAMDNESSSQWSTTHYRARCPESGRAALRSDSR